MDRVKKLVHAQGVYRQGYTGKNVRIVMLDTGVFLHRDIKANIIGFKDFIGYRANCYDDNGHGTQSFNISTTSAFVAAAGGMKVSKHGNRAASSQSGTADCLEALGVNIDQDPQKCVKLLQDVGICFFFVIYFIEQCLHI